MHWQGFVYGYYAHIREVIRGQGTLRRSKSPQVNWNPNIPTNLSPDFRQITPRDEQRDGEWLHDGHITPEPPRVLPPNQRQSNRMEERAAEVTSSIGARRCVGARDSHEEAPPPWIRRASSFVSPPGIATNRLLLLLEISNRDAFGCGFRKSNRRVWTGEERARSRGNGVRGRWSIYRRRPAGAGRETSRLLLPWLLVCTLTRPE
jgi:hypothetical protein